jgi:hypothetical protein
MTPAIPHIKRYLEKSRKRVGGLVCLRCEGRFAGRDAHDRHLVQYPAGAGHAAQDWCHLGEETGLVPSPGGWLRLPAGPLQLDPGIIRNHGVPAFPYRVRGMQIDQEAAERVLRLPSATGHFSRRPTEPRPGRLSRPRQPAS